MTNPTDPAAVEAWRAAYAAVYGCEITRPAHMYGNAYHILQSYGDQREADARADERARVVEWLRKRQEVYRSEYAVSVDPAVRDIADAIERGEHMKVSGE